MRAEPSRAERRRSAEESRGGQRRAEEGTFNLRQCVHLLDDDLLRGAHPLIELQRVELDLEVASVEDLEDLPRSIAVAALVHSYARVVQDAIAHAESALLRVPIRV